MKNFSFCAAYLDCTSILSLQGFVEFNRSYLPSRPATLLKKRLWHRCFPVNFVKFPLRCILKKLIIKYADFNKKHLETISNVFLLIFFTTPFNRESLLASFFKGFPKVCCIFCGGHTKVFHVSKYVTMCHLFYI